MPSEFERSSGSAGRAACGSTAYKLPVRIEDRSRDAGLDFGEERGVDRGHVSGSGEIGERRHPAARARVARDEYVAQVRQLARVERFRALADEPGRADLEPLEIVVGEETRDRDER